MSWPSPQQYNEAIQSPKSCFADPELKQSHPELTILGLPKPVTGSFASVYRLRSKNRDFAVRCFLREIADQKQRYGEISKFVMNDDLVYTVGFEYQERGILVDGEWFPILKMDFVEGCTLDHYIQTNKTSAEKIEALIVQLCTMSNDLEHAGIAHGDFQHGNIMMLGDELRLVDYDGMFVPGLEGWHSNELGQRNYQHPERTYRHFGPYLDRFSLWLIGTSLACVRLDPSLWDIDQDSEKLLFDQEDLQGPTHSKRFYELEQHGCAEIRQRANLFRHVLQYLPEEVPKFDPSLLSPEALPPLKATGKTPFVEPITYSPSDNNSSEPESIFNAPAHLYRLFVRDGAERKTASPKELLAQGKELFNKGDYRSAHEILRNLSQHHPKILAETERAMLNLTNAWLLLQKHDPNEAIVYLTMAVGALPDTSLAALLNSEALRQKGNYEEAMENLRRMVNNGLQIGEASALMSLCEFELGKPETEIVSLVKTALAHQPDCSLAHVVNGKIELANGDCMAALSHFNEALRCSVVHPLALIGRAEAYKLLGHTKRAISEYQDALKVFPDNLQLLVQISRELISSGKWRESLSYLDIAIKLNKEFPESLQMRAEVLLELGNIDRAITDIETALIRQQNNPHLHLLSGIALACKPHRTRDALSALNRSIQLDPTLFQPYVERCKLNRSLSQKQSAQADYESALSLDPLTANNYLKRGMLAIEMNDLQQALSDLTHSEQLASEAQDAVVYRAKIHRLLGDDVKALADLQRVNRCSSAAANSLRDELFFELYFKMALTLYKSSDYRIALDAFTEALRYQPSNKDCLWHRANCYIKIGLETLAIADFELILQQSLLYDSMSEDIIRVILNIAEHDSHGEKLDRFSKRKTKSYMLMYARGRYFMHKKIWKQALVELNAAVRVLTREARDSSLALDRTAAVFRSARGISNRNLFKSKSFYSLFGRKLRLWEAAQRDFRTAVSIDRTWWQGHYGCALTSWDYAIQLHWNEFGLDDSLGVFSIEKSYLRVVDHLTNALATATNADERAELYRFRAEAYGKLSRRKLAQADFLEAEKAELAVGKQESP